MAAVNARSLGPRGGIGTGEWGCGGLAECMCGPQERQPIGAIGIGNMGVRRGRDDGPCHDPVRCR